MHRLEKMRSLSVGANATIAETAFQGCRVRAAQTAATLAAMCANCVSKADVVVATLGFGAYVFKGPIQDGLVEFGILPEPHEFASEIRAVNFLRDLELDPGPIVGGETVEAVDRALAFPREKVYRRSFREAIALFCGVPMRSQRALATE
jgi:hypothetical protein